MNASFIKLSYIEMRALRARHFFFSQAMRKAQGEATKRQKRVRLISDTIFQSNSLFLILILSQLVCIYIRVYVLVCMSKGGKVYFAARCLYLCAALGYKDACMLSLSHTHTHTSLSLSFSLSNTHTHTLTHSHTHSHTHTHTHTHTLCSGVRCRPP
jgi:hypothetical protein